jgi:DNA (cytosine-5)-methyltransferase 1
VVSNLLSPVLCADLFAGAGGFSLAAQNVGMTVKVAVELNKHACATYRKNLIAGEQDDHLIEGDITKITLEEIGGHFTSEYPCDVVLGGPPCQGFSVHRIKGAGISDPRNKLIHRYFEVVRHLKPKVFLMENVPGILWPRHKGALDLFYQVAESSGFRVHLPVVLDARDYAVPQRRKRVFILGVAKDCAEFLHWPPKPSHGSPKQREEEPDLKPWLSCESAFRKAPAEDVNNVHMQHGRELIEAFRNTPANGGSRKDSGRLLPCHEDHSGHKDVYGRIDSRLPAPTMTTACVNPSRGRFVHPTQNHGITVRQAARLQTFPDHYTFTGGIMASATQIGNAVPIKLGEAVLTVIQQFVLANR